MNTRTSARKFSPAVRGLVCWTAVLIASACITSPAQAAFHLWYIKEAYTNSSGSVQFVELFTASASQEFTTGQTLTSNASTFIFPSNTPAPTNNHHLLLATTGFGAIPGGATPDFTIPSNFFSTTSDTLNLFGGVDIKTFSPATDGINSRNFTAQFSGSTLAANSPRNYAGAGSSVNLVPEPASGLLAFGLAALTTLRRRH